MELNHAEQQHAAFSPGKGPEMQAQDIARRPGSFFQPLALLSTDLLTEFLAMPGPCAILPSAPASPAWRTAVPMVKTAVTTSLTSVLVSTTPRISMVTSVSSYNLASKYLADSDDESSGRKSAPLESSQQASKEWAAVSVSDADRHFSSENGSSYGAFDLYQTESSSTFNAAWSGKTVDSWTTGSSTSTLPTSFILSPVRQPRAAGAGFASECPSVPSSRGTCSPPPGSPLLPWAPDTALLPQLPSNLYGSPFNSPLPRAFSSGGFELLPMTKDGPWNDSLHDSPPRDALRPVPLPAPEPSAFALLLASLSHNSPPPVPRHTSSMLQASHPSLMTRPKAVASGAIRPPPGFVTSTQANLAGLVEPLAAAAPVALRKLACAGSYLDSTDPPHTLLARLRASAARKTEMGTPPPEIDQEKMRQLFSPGAMKAHVEDTAAMLLFSPTLGELPEVLDTVSGWARAKDYSGRGVPIAFPYVTSLSAHASTLSPASYERAKVRADQAIQECHAAPDGWHKEHLCVGTLGDYVDMLAHFALAEAESAKCDLQASLLVDAILQAVACDSPDIDPEAEFLLASARQGGQKAAGLREIYNAFSRGTIRPQVVDTNADCAPASLSSAPTAQQQELPDSFLLSRASLEKRVAPEQETAEGPVWEDDMFFRGVESVLQLSADWLNMPAPVRSGVSQVDSLHVYMREAFSPFALDCLTVAHNARVGGALVTPGWAMLNTEGSSGCPVAGGHGQDVKAKMGSENGNGEQFHCWDGGVDDVETQGSSSSGSDDSTAHSADSVHFLWEVEMQMQGGQHQNHRSLEHQRWAAEEQQHAQRQEVELQQQVQQQRLQLRAVLVHAVAKQQQEQQQRQYEQQQAVVQQQELQRRYEQILRSNQQLQQGTHLPHAQPFAQTHASYSQAQPFQRDPPSCHHYSNQYPQQGLAQQGQVQQNMPFQQNYYAQHVARAPLRAPPGFDSIAGSNSSFQVPYHQQGYSSQLPQGPVAQHSQQTHNFNASSMGKSGAGRLMTASPRNLAGAAPSQPHASSHATRCSPPQNSVQQEPNMMRRILRQAQQNFLQQQQQAQQLQMQQQYQQQQQQQQQHWQ